MMELANIATMDALRCLGFVPSRSPYNSNCLSFDFGNCDLEAFPPDFTGRVAFIGSMEGTRRTIYAPIEFPFPGRVISVPQCAAMLSYYLRSYPIANPPPWLVEGRSRQDLLPWMIEAARRQAAYDALPKCFVQRVWLRFALNQLAGLITSQPDEAVIWFDYAGGIFSIECDEERIVVSARGERWETRVGVRVGTIRDLPKRLSGAEVSVVVDDIHVRIGTKYYARLIDPDGPGSTGEDASKL